MLKEDIKRLADGISFFEKTAFVWSLVVLILIVWVRTANLEVDPLKTAGFSGVTGLNVGHGTVAGPFIAFFELLFLLSFLARLEVMRAVVISSLAQRPAQELSPGDLAILANKQVERNMLLAWGSDRFARTLWYFIVPFSAILVCLLRYLEFYPVGTARDAIEEIKASILSKISYHFFTTKAWETQAALSEHFLDTHPQIAEQMPYIYSPVQPWLYLAMLIISVPVAWRACQIYFAEHDIGLPSPTNQSR
jgi:hypothetical protein